MVSCCRTEDGVCSASTIEGWESWRAGVVMVRLSAGSWAVLTAAAAIWGGKRRLKMARGRRRALALITRMGDCPFL